MGGRGPKPMGKIKIKWSPDFAYAIGLITTDGNLSPNGRHINLTSKDKEMATNFIKCLKLNVKIGRKARGGEAEKKYYVVQFGDVLFYNFLRKIGLTPAKSKTLGEIKILDKYFFDFLRGCFDGDGTFYSYWDKRWRSSFMFYTEFTSASKNHIDWLKRKVEGHAFIRGHITTTREKALYHLKYAKSESEKLLRKMYYKKEITCLTRKKLKIENTLAIIGRQL